MAETSVSVSQDQFNCPICLDILKSPVTLHCGHSYCMDCITGCWDQEDQRGSCSCPQCRQTFTPRPVLGKNTILDEMVETFKKTATNSVSTPLIYAGPGDTECDACIGRKCKAVKSCLVCLSSYCETHFRAHNDLNPGKKHKVINAAGKIEDLICSHHDKLLEVFCRTDQTCICLLCAMDAHKKHDTVSTATERTEKQKELWLRQKLSQKTIKEKQENLQELKNAVKSLKISAQATVLESERIFTEIIHSIEKRRSEVTELIRDQERAEVSRAEELIEKLEQEIAELKKRDAEMEQLSQKEDHVHFLQSFQSLFSLIDPEVSSNTNICSDVSCEQVMENILLLEDNVEDLLKQGVYNVTKRVKTLRTIYSPKMLTREDFMTYSRQLSLDPNTAHVKLHLSKRKITCKEPLLPYPDHPQRYDGWQQVLCKDSMTGRCYWEVEWSPGDTWGVFIAVSYKHASRKGLNDCVRFGFNKDSWSLHCSSSGCSFIHCGKVKKVCVVPTTRIGVYVDHKAGDLSFYNINSEKMILLIKEHATFTQPLYPGFWLGTGAKVKLCHDIV